MSTNLSSSEVLHPQHSTPLSAEEIAKAVARHNRHHSTAGAGEQRGGRQKSA